MQKKMRDKERHRERERERERERLLPDVSSYNDVDPIRSEPYSPL
jgi:hypothetical protein